MDSIVYKELGTLTKSKERWEESIPYVASLLTSEFISVMKLSSREDTNFFQTAE